VHAQKSVTPAQLPDVLLNVAVVRPVFLWGAPGIGKSSLVRQFAASGLRERSRTVDLIASSRGADVVPMHRMQ